MTGVFRILHVDDNPGDTLLLNRALKRQNLPVELMVARTGEAAMQVLDQFALPSASECVGFSALLLDLNLPRMSGADVVCAIAARSDLDCLTIAFLTSATDLLGYDLAGAETRVSRHFQKPNSPAGYKPIVGELMALLEPS